MNLDTLSVMEVEKLTRFSTRVKGKDAVAFILFARISEIRDVCFLSAFGGNSGLPTGGRVREEGRKASVARHRDPANGPRY